MHARVPSEGAVRASAVIAALVIGGLLSIGPVSAGAPSSGPTQQAGAVAVPVPPPPPPTVGVLGGLSGVFGESDATFVVNFSVTASPTEVVYAWALGGGLANYSLPTLPAGLTVAATVPSEAAGIAYGALPVGTYSTRLSFAGFTNVVTIAVLGIVGGSALGFQAAAANASNPHPGTAVEAVSAAFTPGAVDYLGVAETGGYPVANWSMPTLYRSSPAWNHYGSTELVGLQTFPTVTAWSAAEGLGVVGLAVFDNASLPSTAWLEPLAGYSTTTGGSNLSFPLNFTVPAGIATVVYAWAIGGGLGNYSLPTLPAGLAVVATLPSEAAGVAAGSLAPGNYSSELFFAGWTNAVSLIAYGVVHGEGSRLLDGVDYQPNPNPKNETVTATVTLNASGTDYLGVVDTGGYAEASWSMSTLDEGAAALNMPGTTETIGRQSTSVVSASSAADGLGLIGVGLYSLTNVTFEETGLRAGASWSVAIGGEQYSTYGSAITVELTWGNYTYLVAGPAGCRVTELPPTGTLNVSRTPLVEPFTFSKGRTVSLTVREKGLPKGLLWSAELGGLTLSSTASSLVFANLTPGSYPYAFGLLPGVSSTATEGRAALPLAGTLALSRGASVTVAYDYLLAVSFQQVGLSSGTYSVTIHGMNEVAAWNQTIVVHLPLGSYSYRLGKVPGYRVFGSPRSVHLTDADVAVEILYAPKG
jgi:hypothetical protein